MGLTLHKHITGEYRLGDTEVFVAKARNGCYWELLGIGEQAHRWLDRNTPTGTRFPRRVDAVQFAQAADSIDPIPRLKVLPVSSLRRGEDGNYRIRAASGEMFLVARRQDGRWWVAGRNGGAFKVDSLWEVRGSLS